MLHVIKQDFLKFFPKILTKRAFIGSLLFGIALWVYASMNGNYSAWMTVPLELNLPENRALEKPVQDTMAVEVRGSGWNLFNLIFFNNSKKIKIDLSGTTIRDSILQLKRQDFLKGIQAFEKVDVADLLPESINIETGLITEQKVPVVPRVQIIPEQGFTVVGSIVANPDSVIIRGNDRLIKQIKFWRTQEQIFKDQTVNLDSKVYLDDTLQNVVKLNTQVVNISAKIQQVADIRFDELPVEIVNGALPKLDLLQPAFVDVWISGGIDVITNLDPSKIKVTLDYSQITSDTTGIVIPRIEMPPDVKLLKMDPPYIYHYIRKFSNQNSLTEVIR